MTPRLFHALTPLALALALTGCAVGPDYVRPDAPLPAAYSTATNPAPSASINPRWWSLFQDAALDELVEQALKNNADLRLAVARLQQADAVAREAGAVLLPQVDGEAGISNSKVSTRTASYAAGAPRIRQARNVGLSTAYEIDLWGRARRANEAAQASLLASTFAQDALRLTVAGTVSRNYLALRAFDAQLAVNAETLASLDDSLKLARSRVDAGLASSIDLHQAERSLAAAQAQTVDLRRQRALSEHQLALVTGNPTLAIPPGDLRNLPLPPVPPAGLPAHLVEARPDVRQAEQELVAANANIGVARAAYYPSLSLTGSLGSESKALSDLLSAGTGTWALGLGAAVPLLDFGRTAARVDQARAVSEQSLITWQLALQTAYKEVRDALVNLRDDGEAEEAQRRRIVAAEKVLELARLRYAAGYAGYLDVLDAQRTLHDAQQTLITTRQSRLSAAVDVFKALGGGWTADTAAPPALPGE